VNSVLRAALEYAERGWPVFPSHGVTARGVCTCGHDPCPSPAKHPHTGHGLQDATVDPRRIRQWWSRWPRANVAIRTGSPSGLVVLDIDLPAGFASLRTLEAGHPLGRSLTARTGGGGAHVFLRHPGGGVSVANRASSVLGTGIDVRGDGGYVIAPPSQHILGSTYRWRSTACPDPMPAWLLDTLVPPAKGLTSVPSAQATVRAGRGTSAWAATALEREVDAVRRAPEGLRNHTLNRAAFVLGQIVGGGHLARDHVSTLLGQAGEDVGLGALETGRTITSGLTAGMRAPRHPPSRRERTVDLRTVPLTVPADRPPPVIEL
jgi:hypothetical protein